MTENNPLENLNIADPDTYVRVKGRIDLMAARPDATLLSLVAEEIIWALAQETGLGQTVADGLLQLMEDDRSSVVQCYIDHVHRAAVTGPTLGSLMARHLVPVLKAGNDMFDRFVSVVRVMRGKGTYTLSEPLAVLSELIDRGDLSSARAYLDLLDHTFEQPITYNHSVRLVHLLPKAVRGFVPKRRSEQIRQLDRVVSTDLQLFDAFVEGMHKGLVMLPADRLVRFMDQALARFGQHPKSGSAFLSLSSTLGKEACDNLQVAVSLNQIKGPLDRYLNARLGRPVSLKPLSALMGTDSAADALVCSDGRFIYLPDEIDHHLSQSENRILGKLLARLEAAYFENGTFDFDLERAADRYPEVHRRLMRAENDVSDTARGDADRFFNCFSRPLLAASLFDLFEMARVMDAIGGIYPGLLAQVRPLLADEAREMMRSGRWDHPLAPLYERLVLGPLRPAAGASAAAVGSWTNDMVRLFAQQEKSESTVSLSARLTCMAYEAIERSGEDTAPFDRPFVPPFGRKLQWDLVAAAQGQEAVLARQIKARLADQDVKIYRSDLQNRLAEQKGRITSDDIQQLVVSPGATPSQGRVQVDWSRLDLEALLKSAGIKPIETRSSNGPAFHYPEWDNQVQEYLPGHARVQETVVADSGNTGFYRRTLAQYQGLVTRIRRAFEFLKPEGLALLRQWPEGDAFDYRALLDFAIDRKAGRIPSDRLYIKRLKQERDVAALLLVDLSRSTANEVAGGQVTVLETAKAALVLFCEALQVVGDTFAIAGFSGTGRHSVDYFRIKDFDEPMAAAVHGRISALQPQRSTRMGAAIRHATAQLIGMPSRVRLLIVVTDGFPNDIGYKGDYAVADTRIAAQEARAQNVHLKAITVNIGSDPGLDDLYGRVHHHVIGDVRDLPDKLLRLYGTLTRRM